MKYLALLSCLVLGACGSDISDLQTYTDEVKANAKTSIEPMPTVKKYQSFEYSVNGLRSPFVKPKPELIDDATSQTLGCLQPNFNRQKEALEKYPLETIKMRGTLGEAGRYFALASVADGALYRVKVGNYMGLFHGQIQKITSDKVILQEMIPDGTGCWETRTAQISIFAQDSESGSQNNE
ncbi:pilus assembly protein PilP [Catenovulum adriaticum]|uniref:Pilus assembly protein PilP n=1 Tax=Catenovulum adriaticum TaxID=2984846 RepID=A0ABY7ALZ2_9ALTE|nr:pilus assembly protein PilP [Catenovulum sp. TS8]WAJ70262.1 pilus assembly protein PilP [Catenovulum sp. TS8]